MSISSDEIANIRDLFRDAERQIKRAEEISGELAIPAVNELRYAGWHLLEALCSGDPDNAVEQLARARRHCQRAIFDASDTSIIYLLEKIRTFQDDYRRFVISDVIPDYSILKKTISSTRHKIEKAREGNDRRESYYLEAASSVGQLKDIGDRLDDSREELNKAVRRQNRETFKFWLMAILTAVAAVAAVLALLK
ncbi:MAG: hypothetical protein P9C36_05730 [Defluviicoccus sp.]|nr:hypothetical protein [Defluviicoccus sp.]MDG4592109.1 hypothetical protein [Defluviicoccus sp.]MDS4074257.1 hypothetical protein [Defluviicoccus sp.]